MSSPLKSFNIDYALGVPHCWLRLYPHEPDPVNTGVGKSSATKRAYSALLVLPKVLKLIRMEVLVNNQTITTPASCTIEKLLPLLGVHDTRGIAIAVNEQVIAKTSWLSHQLMPQDKIMLIKATQGG